MAYRAALVDFDGTLADSMPWWLELPRRTLAEEGIPEPEGFEQAIREVPMREIAVWLGERFPSLTAGPPLAERWYAMMEDNYRHRVRLKPGALEFLAALRQAGLTVVILSATKRPLLDTGLSSLGLTPLVDEVFSEREIGSKRTAEPYLFCARQLGAELPELLLAEDAHRNLSAAAALGLGTVGVFDESMAVWQEEIRRTSDVYLADYRDLTPLRTWLRRSRGGSDDR